VLLPFALLVVANRVGWHFSLAFATGLLTLVAVVALPRDLNKLQRAIVFTAAVGQAIAAWWLLPWPRVTAEDRAAHAVAEALSHAPDRSILMDDRFAPRLLKWAPSLAPYLTTRDVGFDLALSDPATKVDYMLVTTDADGLTLDADVHPPTGFVVNWSWSGYTLYRRADVAGLPVRYDAVLGAEAGGQ